MKKFFVELGLLGCLVVVIVTCGVGFVTILDMVKAGYLV